MLSVPSTQFGWETVFTSTLCQAGKLVGGGDLPSSFFGAVPESVERGFGTCNSVSHPNCVEGIDNIIFVSKHAIPKG